MYIILKCIKIILNISILIMLLLFSFIIFSPVINPVNTNPDINNEQRILPFSLNASDVNYDNKTDDNISEEKINGTEMSDRAREEILDKAKAMTDVKWIPQYSFIDKKGFYIFTKGKTYYGVPYSMDSYQVTSANDFLSKMNESKTLYGNDCSGFVSAVWGISRQTTLSLYNAMKEGKIIDGKAVCQISWYDLKPADALLVDNGKGEGHIMLFINVNKKNSNNLNVYEQNIPTIIPFEPIPVARQDVRVKDKLKREGYIPIRLINVAQNR